MDSSLPHLNGIERTGSICTGDRLLSTAGVTRSERYRRSGEMRGSARRLLADRSEMRVRLRNPGGHREDTRRRCCGTHGKRRKRSGPRTLGIGAGRIGLGMLMMTRMIMGAVVMHGTGGIRIAQHD